jgi:hypothetical protein
MAPKKKNTKETPQNKTSRSKTPVKKEEEVPPQKLSKRASSTSSVKDKQSPVKLEKTSSARSASSNKQKDIQLKVKETVEEEKKQSTISKSVDRPHANKAIADAHKDHEKAPSNLLEFNKLIGTLLMPTHAGG